MDQIWIGGIKANDVSGTIGIGFACLTGPRALSKTNVGNGTVTGDQSQLFALAALIEDPDFWDCVATMDRR